MLNEIDDSQQAAEVAFKGIVLKSYGELYLKAHELHGDALSDVVASFKKNVIGLLVECEKKWATTSDGASPLNS